MVTPSLVMVGAPHFLSMTTLRPFGPSVTLTTSARASTPRCSASRASVSNDRILAITPSLELSDQGDAPDAGRSSAGAGASTACVVVRDLLLDDREHVAGGKDEVLVGAELDLGAAVLGEDDGVTFLDVQRKSLTVLEPAGADGENGALLGLFLGGVGDHDARRRRLLGLQHRHDDAVLEGLDVDLAGRGHDLPPPTIGCGWTNGRRPVRLPSRGSGLMVSVAPETPGPRRLHAGG